MNRKAKLLGHPIHQMLIVFPLGLLATAVVFDLVTLISGNSAWSSAAFYMIGAGIVGGLLAAMFGFWDWLTIPAGTRAKTIGAYHGVGNLAVVLLFVGSFVLRYNNPNIPGTMALACSFTAGMLALVTGWLGGELVDRLGVGVDANAHVNAPSSLKDRSYHDRSNAA